MLEYFSSVWKKIYWRPTLLRCWSLITERSYSACYQEHSALRPNLHTHQLDWFTESSSGQALFDGSGVLLSIWPHHSIIGLVLMRAINNSISLPLFSYNSTVALPSGWFHAECKHFKLLDYLEGLVGLLSTFRTFWSILKHFGTF